MFKNQGIMFGLLVLLCVNQVICLQHTNNNQIVIGSSIGGVLGLIILILDLIAVFELLKSGRGLGSKLLWILLIIFFPVGGLLIYLCCGRRKTVDSVV
ncbi:unnamed protein product [Didymodactylos carnosus]|uniref:Cardiolipin synthase N-terminal domain-containing protein n=1 Tax=Didymodactylos carnosus TaxID=1234261 RepID=A0A813YSF0_9BILA|nr:unnamed protein product [Didymodactylos carnosus]CAF1015126.1 unnamed protein product [Didymodactylos carnosus]CAF3672980.1 unnamed protein product [Didymodactylos carnosus]CAF3784241.1 unnamed protein product [Didymodactylos carnosus]